jgi:O-antigen ligase
LTTISLNNTKQKKNYWNRSSILVFVYGLVLPVEDFLFQDILGSASRIVASIIFLDYLIRRGFPSFKYVSKYSVYYCTIILLSLTWSTYPDFQGVFRIYFLLLSSIIFAVLYKEDKSTIFKFLYGFMLSGCYLGVKTLSEFNVVGLVVRVTIEEMNNNSLANSIAVTSLFMIFIISNKQLKKVYIPFFFTLILVNLGGIIATGSRGAMLSFLFCLLFYLRKLWSKYVLLGFSLFFIALSFSNVFEKVEPFIELITARTEKGQDDHGGNRIPIWKAGITMFFEQPLTGVGFRNFRFLSPSYAEKSTLLARDEYDNFFAQTADTHPAHNNYLDTLCELGIIGFLFFITWLVQCFIGCYRETSKDAEIVMIILIYFLVSSFFGDLYNIKMFWVISGISGYYYFSYVTLRRERKTLVSTSPLIDWRKK